MTEQEKNLVAAMREVRSFLAGQAVLLLDLPGYRNAYGAIFEAMEPYEKVATDEIRAVMDAVKAGGTRG